MRIFCCFCFYWHCGTKSNFPYKMSPAVRLILTLIPGPFQTNKKEKLKYSEQMKFYSFSSFHSCMKFIPADFRWQLGEWLGSATIVVSTRSHMRVSAKKEKKNIFPYITNSISVNRTYYFVPIYLFSLVHYCFAYRKCLRIASVYPWKYSRWYHLPLSLHLPCRHSSRGYHTIYPVPKD